MSVRGFTRIHHFIEHQEDVQPEAPALVDHNKTIYTYRAFNAAIDEAVCALKAAGIEPHDRVLIIAENCVAAAAFIFATSKVGAWAVPVNARMTLNEINRIIEHADPRAIVHTTDVSKEATAHAHHLDARRQKLTCGEVRIAQRPPSVLDVSHEAEKDIAVILYTTGTTGDPKGVMLTHKNLLFAANASATFRKMTPQDVIYGGLPLTHVFGLASTLMAGTLAGACIRLHARFAPEALCKDLLNGITLLPAVPQMHALVMQYARENSIEKLNSKTLRYVSSGAAPLDPAWKRDAEAFYGVPLQNGYGMTEATAGVCTTKNTLGNGDISVGFALPGTEVALDTPDGEGIGEVLVNGPHVMAGYFKNPAETAKVIRDDGWLRTGDLGRFDGDGRLHITGRSKELIIRSGFNVYPQEVEAALNDFPGVVHAAVVGRKVEGNEEVLAFIQQAKGAGLTEDALKAHSAERLASYKRPARIIITEQLPAAATGKILKHKLLDVFKDKF
ncbi:MAG: class I adenylate-forming enzyme family protein [Hyphomicrobiales bacterium]